MEINSILSPVAQPKTEAVVISKPANQIPNNTEESLQDKVVNSPEETPETTFKNVTQEPPVEDELFSEESTMERFQRQLEESTRLGLNSVESSKGNILDVYS